MHPWLPENTGNGLRSGSEIQNQQEEAKRFIPDTWSCIAGSKNHGSLSGDTDPCTHNDFLAQSQCCNIDGNEGSSN